MRTVGEVLTTALVLRSVIAKLEGDYVGIMLPASVAATVTYLATMLAGKTPVMVNWTVGTRSVLHSLDQVGVKSVLTPSRVLLAKLEQAWLRPRTARFSLGRS